MSQSFATLAEWLAYIEQQHVRSIDLTLDRVGRVCETLAAKSEAVIITVGGTNGKGSTCSMLEAILSAAGYRTGLYTSPHLIRYNERVRIGGIEVSDSLLCDAFAAVDAARGDVPLTYFEYGTLAAWWLFCQSALDVIILEVGLGGRLDAVNLFDSDCAVVTGVALDHMDYLGDTRDAIGYEKAGIFRAGKPAVCGDLSPPETLLAHAERIGARLFVHGQHFGFRLEQSQWDFWGPAQRKSSLAYPALRGRNQLSNASSALMALETLADVLPVSMQAVREGLATAIQPGRFQVLPGRPAIILDVAHNPQAGAVLADNLAGMGFYRSTWGICGMLSDKDIAGTLRPLLAKIDHWLLCDLHGPRAATAQQLASQLLALNVSGANVQCFDTPGKALQHALEHALQDDRIAAFGSFLTVADAMNAARSFR